MNRVTETLFRKYRTAEDYLRVPEDELKADIHATGFFNQKAISIREACRRIVEEYGGHGIGSSMHMDPFLPNHGVPGQGLRLAVGMALAVEPMLTAASPATRELDDGWTVVTADGGRAAHWEQEDSEGRTLRRTRGFASLGGATLDNEENYLIKKLFTALGAIQVENQARI